MQPKCKTVAWFVSSEPQQRCCAVPRHLPDGPHHAGYSTDWHGGGWTHQLWEAQAGRCRLPVVFCMNDCDCSQFAFYCSALFFSVLWVHLCSVLFLSPVGVWDSLSDSAASGFLFPLRPSRQPSYHHLAAGAHTAHRPGEVRHTLTPLQYSIKTIRPVGRLSHSHLLCFLIYLFFYCFLKLWAVPWPGASGWPLSQLSQLMEQSSAH